MNHLSSGQVPQATRTRVIVVLVLGQMLGGLGVGSAVSVGGLTGGPVLVAIGYSGLAAVAMVPAAVIVVTQLTVTARRAGTARPRG